MNPVWLQVISHALEEYGLKGNLEDVEKRSLKEQVHRIAAEIGIATGW